MAQWYAGAVVSRVCEDGIRRWLVINTKSMDPKYINRPVQTKFCGGTEEHHEDEDKTILYTRDREFTEETDMVLKKDGRYLIIHCESLPCHFKNFYDIDWSDCEGTLRTVEKTIEGDWMSAPYWVTFEEGCRILYGHHNSALQKSAERHKVKTS